jgi:hypothetical protein
VGPGLIPYSKSGVAMMEIHNALGLNYEVSDPDYYRKVRNNFYRALLMILTSGR